MKKIVIRITKYVLLIACIIELCLIIKEKLNINIFYTTNIVVYALILAIIAIKYKEIRKNNLQTFHVRNISFMFYYYMLFIIF